MSVTAAARDTVAARARGSASGARSIEAFLAGSLLPDLSARFLSRMAEGSAIDRIEVDAAADGSLVCEIV